MPRDPWRAMAVLAVAVVLAARPARASQGGDFDVRVDDFTVDGNVFGVEDGAPDRVDAFDDGFLDGWFIVNGTAFERDGFLHLASPGDRVADGFGAVPGLPLDISQVYYTSPVARGAGSFTVTVSWASTKLRYGDFNHVSLYAYADPGNAFTEFEVVGVALSNPTPDDAPPAYSATRFVVRHLGAGFEPVATESVPIDPNDIRGEVVFRHRFDDATDTVVTAVSIDGGATFTEPFTEATLFTGTSKAVFLLGSDPIASSDAPAPEACSAGLLLPETVVSIARHGGTLAVRGAVLAPPAVASSYDPLHAGAQLRVEDDGLDRALLDLTRTPIPPGGPGSGCGPGDGWVAGRAVYTYRNRSNAMPPGCAPGSGDGLRMLRVGTRSASSGRLAVRALVDGVSPKVAGPVRLTLVLGSDAGAGAAGWCGSRSLTCTHRRRAVRCAPAG